MLELRLPNAIVTLRGEVPVAVAESLADLTDARLHHGRGVAEVDVDVEATVDGWTLLERSRGAAFSSGAEPRRSTAGPAEVDLLDAVVSRLNRLAFATDPSRLHLHAAGLEYRGDGILLLGPSGSGKSTVATALVTRGAAFLSDESITLQPGSRTAYAYPKPITLKAESIDLARQWVPGGGSGLDLVVAQNGRAHLRASSLGEVVPYVEPKVVVVVRHDTKSTTFRPITTAEACMHVLGDSLDAARFGPAALEVVAWVLSAAVTWELVYGDASDAADALMEIRPAFRRRLVVAGCVGWDPVPTASGSRFVSPDRSVRTVRFDDGAVRLDGATRSLTLLDVGEPGLGHSGGASTANDEVWRFALPDRPVDDLDAAAPLRDADVDALRFGRCTGVGVEQLLRDRPGPGVAERLRHLHTSAQTSCLVLERELAHVVDLLEAHGVEPVVLKGPVSAHDGPLPPHLRDFGDLDLLIRTQHIDTAVAVLTGEGFERRFPKLSEDFDRRFSKSVTLHGAFRTGGHAAAGRTFEVDLHRTLTPGPYGFLVDLEELHDRAVPVRVAGRWYRALHPTHRFVHHCLHAALGSAPPRLHSLRDVLGTAPRAPAVLDDVIEVVERWGVTAPVRRALQLASPDRDPGADSALRDAPYESSRRRPVQARWRDQLLLASYHRGRRSYACTAAASLLVLPGWEARAAFLAAHLGYPRLTRDPTPHSGTLLGVDREPEGSRRGA